MFMKTRNEESSPRKKLLGGVNHNCTELSELKLKKISKQLLKIYTMHFW